MPSPRKAPNATVRTRTEVSTSVLFAAVVVVLVLVQIDLEDDLLDRRRVGAAGQLPGLAVGQHELPAILTRGQRGQTQGAVGEGDRAVVGLVHLDRAPRVGVMRLREAHGGRESTTGSGPAATAAPRRRRWRRG